MSEIEEQISNNEKSINDIKQKIIRLQSEIKSLTNNRQRTLRLNQIREYKKNLTALTNLNKALLRRIPQPKDSDSDEELEREVEQLMRQEEDNRIRNEEEENRIRSEQQQKKLSDREQEYKSKTGKEYNPLLNTEEVEEEIFRADEEEQQKNLPDPDEYVTLSNDPPIIQSFSKTRRITPSIESISSKNKTKKIRPTPEGIELEDFKKKTPKQVPLEDFEINDEYFKEPVQEKESSKRVPFEIEFEDSNKNTQTPKQVPLEDVEINEVYLKEPEQEKEPSKLLQPLGFTETLKKAKPKKPQKISENKCQYIYEDNTKYFFPSQFPNITKKRPITFALKKGGKRKTRKYVRKNKNPK